MITRAVREQAGLTIVEVMVAAMILIIGALGVLAIGDAATRNTYRAEQSQVVVNRLQAELEHLRQLPFAEVALTAAPSSSADPASPTGRVQGSTFALSRNGTNPRPLAINGRSTPTDKPVVGGAIAPGPEAFTSGDVSGKIYRYVVYPGPPANCAPCNADDIKRVVVAIALDPSSSGGVRAYQEIQSDVTNPDAAPAVNQLPPPPNDGTSELATFWLTDTPCSRTTRQALAGDPIGTLGHPLHNTRGTCGDGLKTGATRGAPDLMFNRPPGTAGPGSVADPTYDYATDPALEPQNAVEPDIGLNIRRTDSASGCVLSAPAGGQLDFPALSLESDKQQKMHMWLSNPLSDAFRLLTSATATLDLQTRTINAASYPGKICIWVFKRVTALNQLGLPITVDLPAINVDPPLVNAAHFTYTRNPWLQQWRGLAVPMNMVWANNHLSGLNVVSGSARLGLAITVERAGTGAGGIEFNYDHPSYESMLQIKNTQGLNLIGG
jgi:hypothetical protein